jgi:hypothetical protein
MPNKGGVVGEKPDIQRIERPSEETRSLTTDAAILAAPTVAVVANHLLNKPKSEPPPKIELPPGTDRK